jgi:acetyl esterase/lipase
VKNTRARAVAGGIALGLALVPTAASAQAPSGEPIVNVQHDVSYGTAGGVDLLMDVYRPPSGSPPYPAVVVIHGGGWYTGDKSDADVVKASKVLAIAGYVAFNIDYRLAPEHPFPAADEDAAAAVRFVRENADAYGVDPARIGLAGLSAGSTIAGYVAYSGSGSWTSGSRVAAVVTWSGPFDLVAYTRQSSNSSIESLGHGWLAGEGNGTQVARSASPIAYVDASDPPLLMTNAEHEQSPLAQPEAMKARLEAAGIPVYLRVLPGSDHALNGQNALNALPDTVLFFDRYLKSAPIPGALGAASEAPSGPARRPFVVGIVALLVGALLGAAITGAARRPTGPRRPDVR